MHTTKSREKPGGYLEIVSISQYVAGVPACHSVWFRTRAELADPHRDLGDSVRSGQRDRHHRTNSCRADFPDARSADDRRRHRRCGWNDRRQPRREGATGRLSDRSWRGGYLCAEPVSLQNAAIQFGDRFRSGGAGDRTAAAPGGSERFASHQPKGVRGLSESQSGEDAFRLCRYRCRAVPRLLDVDIGHRGNRDACPLSKRRAGARGHDSGATSITIARYRYRRAA